MNTTIANALELIRPLVAEQYARQVRHSFEQMVEQFGPTLHGVHNSRYARAYSCTVAWIIQRSSDRTNATLTISEEKLARRAAEYAEAATLEWLKKIEAKVGDLEGVEVKQFHGANFLISGHRDGHAVSIDQQMIMKCSTKGLWFNQFPARIYVDGKFTPEKKYHALFVKGD